jgi:hypothetical protein
MGLRGTHRYLPLNMLNNSTVKGLPDLTSAPAIDRPVARTPSPVGTAHPALLEEREGALPSAWAG